MGAAPSAEILRDAPFRSARGGPGRVLALIPATQELFSSPDSPLFTQLYEARNDPYVRYYLCRNMENSPEINLDNIPRLTLSREEYYASCIKSLSTYHCYQTNESLRQDYFNSPPNRHLIRPIPCAVAFQYDDPFSAPEGCAPLDGTYVKIIGGIGCVVAPPGSNSEEATTEREETMELKIFLRKSAGDHNMVRVMLFSASLFYDHCVGICGLPRVPMISITFRSLMTNIPFLCFLRELRNRIDLLQGNTQEHSMWIDGPILHGFITAQHASELCEVLGRHYKSMVESKPRARQDVAALPRIDQSVFSTDVGKSNTVNDVEDTGLSASDVGVGRNPKQFFTLGGFIDRSNAVIPTCCGGANEVYAACVDASVRVVCEQDAASPKDGAEAMLSDAVWINVKRGDILRFEPDEMEDELQIKSKLPPSCEIANDGLFPSAFPSASGDYAEGDATSDVQLRHGTWHVDSSIYLENVLLSFVHNECKWAREASAEDPHWLRDQETGELIFDENFYIWRFERKGSIYYYGTVPKFAHTQRRAPESTRQRGAVAASAGIVKPSAHKGGAQRQDNSIYSTGRGSPSHSDALRQGAAAVKQNWGCVPMTSMNEAQNVPFVMGYMNQSAVMPPHAVPISLVQMQQQQHCNHAGTVPTMLLQPTTTFVPSFNGVPDAHGGSLEKNVCEANYTVYPAVVPFQVPCMPSIPTPCPPLVQYVPYMQPVHSLHQPQQVPATYVYLDPSTVHLVSHQQQHQPPPFMPVSSSLQQSGAPPAYGATPL